MKLTVFELLVCGRQICLQIKKAHRLQETSGLYSNYGMIIFVDNFVKFFDKIVGAKSVSLYALRENLSARKNELMITVSMII